MIVQLFVLYLLSIAVNATEQILPSVAGRLAEGGDRAQIRGPIPRSAGEITFQLKHSSEDSGRIKVSRFRPAKSYGSCHPGDARANDDDSSHNR